MWLPDKIYGFPDCENQSRALAQAIGANHEIVQTHKFPDGECCVRVSKGALRPAVFRSLYEPNEKLVEIIFASSALRDNGASEVALIAPYLAYMRQDVAFRPGEAISQKVIGEILSKYFDRFLSIDPHLHRTPTLDAVFRGKPSISGTAAAAIAEHIATHIEHSKTIIIGPDIESKPLVKAVADPLGASWLVAAKTRHGDRNVSIKLPDHSDLRGRHMVIVDDVISSGGTIVTLSGLLTKAGAASVSVYTTHALFGEDAHLAMRDAGAQTITSCDSIPHPTNAISLAKSLAESIKLWP